MFLQGEEARCCCPGFVQQMNFAKFAKPFEEKVNTAFFSRERNGGGDV
jgi:hypothetical protein